MQRGKILFATDYTAASRRALPFAASLARATGSMLTIVHVTNVERKPVGELLDSEPQPPLTELQRLQEVEPDDPRVAYEHRLLYAQPDDEGEQIIKIARRENVSLIVIGTHGRWWLSRYLTGSVAQTVLEKSPCPVVTVQQPEAAVVPIG